MARDFKHGYGKPKQTYQRRSQQGQETEQVSSSGKRLVVVAVFLSVLFIGGFVIIQHFATQGIKGEKEVAEVIVEESLPAQIETTELEEKAEAPVVKSVLPSQQVKQTVETIPVKQNEPVKYTFYKGLAETEVVVDAEPISVELPVPYYVQAGSFGRKEVAEKEQARLRGYGHELEVSRLETSVRVYYRLRLGPFTNRLEMNKQRNKLRMLGVDTLLVKSKKKSS